MDKGSYYKKYSFLVAGPGFAPGSSDYEPDEVLFLHPAPIMIGLFSSIDKLKAK
jgi:hypothetical protein